MSLDCPKLRLLCLSYLLPLWAFSGMVSRIERVQLGGMLGTMRHAENCAILKELFPAQTYNNLAGIQRP